VTASSTPEPHAFWKGLAFGTLCAVIWGIQAVVSRQSVADGMTAVDVTILRFVGAGIALLPFAIRLRPFPVGVLGWPRLDPDVPRRCAL
jgi:drug/metabolite transporter (DMT)-like permease